MKRLPEPELMEEDDQARAYAEADFDEPHSMFLRLWEEAFGGDEPGGRAVDLGCGPADIAVRFARRYPGVLIDAVDGSAAMLSYGRTRLQREGLEARIRLVLGVLPAADLPAGAYGAIISNSLLHHLSDPAVLWRTVKACARPGSPVLVMDLMRPGSEAAAHALVEQYAAGEPEVLRQDFFRSLLAAYRPEEVRAQLDAAGLGGFEVRVVSDRHIAVTGRVAAGLR